MTVGSILSVAASQVDGSLVDTVASTLVGLLFFLFFQNLIFFRNPIFHLLCALKYGRYSVEVFANASERFDLHQDTVPVPTKPSQAKVLTGGGDLRPSVC